LGLDAVDAGERALQDGAVAVELEVCRPLRRDLAAMDLRAEHQDACFRETQILDFAEDDGPRGEIWPPSWTIIRAEQ
jgi:hypothetical protein